MKIFEEIYTNKNILFLQIKIKGKIKMNSSIVINKILKLNYKGFKEAYIRQIEDINYNQLSFDERLYDLLIVNICT